MVHRPYRPFPNFRASGEKKTGIFLPPAGVHGEKCWDMGFFEVCTPCQSKKTMLYSRSNMILLDLFR